VQLVISGCHHGLRDAIAAVLPGAATAARTGDKKGRP
jgi:hypothetical protein